MSKKQIGQAQASLLDLIANCNLDTKLIDSIDCAGKFCIYFENLKCIEGRGQKPIGFCGIGNTYEEACHDYCMKISGLRLYFNNGQIVDL